MEIIYVWVLIVNSYGTETIDPRRFNTGTACVEAGVEQMKFAEDQMLCVPERKGSE